MWLNRLHAPGLVTTLVLITLSTSGCQSLSLPSLFTNRGAEASTLGSLQPVTLKAADTPASPISLNEVIDGYEALLPLLDDPQAIASTRHRLADLRLQRAEAQRVDQSVKALGVAVEAYEQLLAQYPKRLGNDQVYYQLAKAYDLNGNRDAHLQVLNRLISEHPDSVFWVEAQFRRGELLFSNDQYPEAQAAFDAVIRAPDQAQGKQTFLTNAQYMKGWCQFKQNDYQAALHSYVAVLDRLLPANQPVAAVDEKHRTLVEDLFRVMGLSFNYLNGAESLVSLFETLGSKPYEIQVYDRYSKLLLDKEQYTDAIQVYARYIETHPMSPWAPRYQMNILDTLHKAGFASTMPARQAEFIRTYGITSAYWAQAQEDVLDYIRQQLEQLLPELASRHAVKAQQASAKAQGKTRQNQDRDEARADYQAAARYYAEFAETFPTHPKTPHWLFLLAETHLELQQWAQAIAVFERIAYEVKGHDKAAEAGYASVLAYRIYAPTWMPQPADAYRAALERQQQSRLRFVASFPADPRAVEVLYLAAQYHYEQKDYPAVLTRAQQIIDWQPSPASRLLLEARLLKAHSFYALANYPQAEQAYQDARQWLPADDQRTRDLQENQAASVYRQAEAHLASGDKLAAVEEFLRVGQAAPGAGLRANADYDAAITLIELKQWQRAIGVMTAFRLRYPQHEQIPTLPARMALAYRETGQWALAAAELQTLSAHVAGETEKRETLLLAAELYERAQQPEKAILSYRQYATEYPLPLDSFMEAANRLAELYAKAQNPEQQRVWLRKQMGAVDPNASQSDDRMRYLAAQASAVLARDDLQAYNAIRLGEPLSETVGKKITALEKAVKAFQKTVSYGVASSSTEAGYHIADIYARLGRDLMDAERPAGLSELEQSQYDLLLEEQAFPFEEKAIIIHEQNASRSWNGLYDEWVQRSFDALKQLLPGRYDKPERISEVVDDMD